jgi:hypothetical protein
MTPAVRHPAALARAHRRLQLLGLLAVPLLREPLGVLGRRVDQLLRGLQGAADLLDPQRQLQYGGPALAGGRVGGQPAGPVDVALGGAGRRGGDLRLDALPAYEHVGDGLDRGRTQIQVAAAGADGGQDVLDGGGAQQPHRAGGRLLDGLQDSVGRFLVQPLGVLDEDDLPAAVRRGGEGLADGVPHVVGEDLGADGGDRGDVRVGADKGGVAAVAETAAGDATEGPVGADALERGGEGPRRLLPSRAGRAGEQPGVGHLRRLGRRGVARGGGDERVGVPGSGGELLAHLLLSDQVVPHAHGSRRPSVTSRRSIHCAGGH